MNFTLLVLTPASITIFLLNEQAAGLSNARNALFDRIQYMHNTIGGLRQREEADARMAVDGSDETLQAYGYSGALQDRKQSLQEDMQRQMQQMAYQQQLLQQQLSFIAGMYVCMCGQSSRSFVLACTSKRSCNGL